MAARRIPIIRIGITIIVGSALISLFKFYIHLGDSFASPSGTEQSTKTPDLVKYFAKDLLIAGTMPTAIFWLGTLITLLGFALKFTRSNNYTPEAPT
jgi:hypothetical protein